MGVGLVFSVSGGEQVLWNACRMTQPAHLEIATEVRDSMNRLLGELFSALEFNIDTTFLGTLSIAGRLHQKSWCA